MPRELTASEFLEQAVHLPVVDVRAPVEYARGHIPGAHNICLFTDEERAEIGTLYHRNSREEAISRGLDLVSPKLGRLVRETEALVEDTAGMTGRSPLQEQQISKHVLLYCFRGGMRSNSFAFLLETAGFEVGLLKGGYKAFRAHIHESFTRAQSIVVLGGMTGSGKTEMLHRLSEQGMQVIDLEGLARHKGSVFGGIGQQTQPSSEHFENLLFDQWRWQNPENPLVLEDENMDIGGVKLPQTIWRRIRSAPLVVLDVPFETRVQRLVREYAGSDDELNVAIRRIERRLGNLRMNQALQAVADGDRAAAARILLAYYDESYEAGIMKRKAGTVVRVDASGDVLSELIRQIIKLSCPGIHAGE